MGISESKTEKLPAELTNEQLEDISKNTGLPMHDIAQWYQRFYDFSNGKDLDKKHFKKYFKELLPNNGNSDKFCDLAFCAFDTNSNQKVDYSEIIIGFSHIYKPDLNNRLRWMFNLYDQNKDGYIDQSELKTAIKAILLMRNNSEDNFDAIVEEVYKSFKSEDGKISLENFLEGAKANSKLCDIICPKDF